MHLLNGLSPKFDNIINVIKHRSPPCTFNTARSMLKDEEDRLKTKHQTQSSHTDHASSPQVLIASSPPQFDARSSSSPNQFQYTQGGRGNRGGRHGRGGRNNKGGRGVSNWQGNNWNSGSPPPWAFPTYPQWPNYFPWSNAPQWPNASPSPNQHWPNSGHPSHFQPPSSSSHTRSGILGHAPSPAGSAYLTTHNATAPQTPQVPNSEFIPTTLANAFNTMTLSDPSDAGWYMDTGATAHLTSQSGTLDSISSRSSLPLITVGNGSLLPAIAYGHSSIPSSSRPLYLKNVLLCPKILKNLISVRQFTIDNLCSVEFDPFGFIVKDLHTRAPLIRCDSTGPLYAVSPPSPSTSHQVFLTSPSVSIWHQRLGHPGDFVLRF